MTVETYRDEIWRRSPPWLQRNTALRFLYALGLHMDVFGDAVVAAVKHRFPGLYSYEALGLIGRERRIARGRLETDPSYAVRLRRWLTDHRTRGGPYALLNQIYAHYAPAVFPIDLVYYSGRRFAMDVDGNITIGLSAWKPDTDTDRWARWWLFYHTDQWAVTPPTDAEVVDLRLVPSQWNATHTLGTIVLIPTNAELWNFPPGRVWNDLGKYWNVGGGGTVRYIEVDQ